MKLWMFKEDWCFHCTEHDTLLKDLYKVPSSHKLDKYKSQSTCAQHVLGGILATIRLLKVSSIKKYNYQRPLQILKT